MRYSQDDFIHNSRDLYYRSPYGAQPCGETITLKVDVSPALRHAYIIIEYFVEGDSKLLLMEKEGIHDERYVFSASLRARSDGGLMFYRFIINDRAGLTYYCGTTGRGYLCDNPTNESYQITVHSREYETPSWMRDSIMYHIFVDRFSRGNGRGGLERANYHTEKGRDIIMHEDWGDQPLYLPQPGHRNYDPCDFYGGDIKGIINKLDYLQNLGVGCIYLSPIFESNSNHKYNTSDYMKVDAMFDSGDDFAQLCESAKERGIRIMLDGVFSHTGDDSVYFNKFGHYDSVGAYQSLFSPYYSWYKFRHHPTDYDCWWGFETMPNVDEMNVKYLNFVVDGDDSVVKHWIHKGAMGWRLDVADELPDEFIAKMRVAIKSADNEAAILGEVWEDASTKYSMDTHRKYVFGDELDSVMNYPFRNTVMGFLTGYWDSEAAVNSFETLREHYPMQFFYSCMNLISSHDVPRALSVLGGYPEVNSSLSREQQAHYALTPVMRELGLRRMRLALLLQMSMPGMPSVYYGDEAGVEGLKDPFNRSTYPWGHEDTQLLDFFQRLCIIRQNSIALRTGQMVVFSANNDAMAIVRFCAGEKDVFGRPGEDGTYIALINRSHLSANINIDFSKRFIGPDADLMKIMDGEYSDLLSNEMYSIKDKRLKMTLKPFSAVLLKNR